MRSFILLLCLIPTIICAQNLSLEDQLKQAIKGKKAEIGIAVIIDGKDTVTVNNDIHYPLMSVFKFHQALALADYMGKQQQSLNFELTIKKEDLKPDTYSPLRDSFPQGGFNIDIADLLKYTLQQSDNNACDILFQYQGPPMLNQGESLPPLNVGPLSEVNTIKVFSYRCSAFSFSISWPICSSK